MTLGELMQFLDDGSTFVLHEFDDASEDDKVLANITKGLDLLPASYRDRRVILVDISELQSAVSIFVSREAVRG